MNRASLAITGCAILTPFDAPCAPRGWTGTWEQMSAGKRLEKRTGVDDALLEGSTSLDRSIRMALAAAQQAAGTMSSHAGTALFCGTSKGPVGVMLAALEKLRRGENVTESEARHIMLGTGAIGAFLADALALRGPVQTSVAACASGMFALHRAAEALRRGECERAIVVAADASLHPLFEGSFARLGVLSPADAEGARRCEPFGAEGQGFFLSEAAAALVIEKLNPRPPTSSARADSCSTSPGVPPFRQPLAFLDSTWIGSDGTGLVAVDPCTDTLRRGLRQLAGLKDIIPAFVHAHATGTEHDRLELEAIRAALGEQFPAECIFSHKGQLGHSLGAAGLVSVALSVLCHLHGRTFTGQPVAPGATSITIAQGFGGHVGVVRLRGAAK